MPSCIIRGVEARVIWGYHDAATLGPWELTASDTGGTLTATVVTANAFGLTQPDLTFCVTRQNGIRLTWPVLSLQVAGETLTASVGPQE